MGYRIVVIDRGHSSTVHKVAEATQAYSDVHGLGWSVVQAISRLDGSFSVGGVSTGLEADGEIWIGGGLLQDQGHAAHPTRVLFIGGLVARRPCESMLVVGTDDVAIGTLAARHCHEQGYRVGFVAVPGTGRPLASYRRLTAFHEFFQAHGLPTGVLPRPAASTGWPTAFAALRNQAGPVALFCHQDRQATWLRRHLQEAGFNVPGEVGLIGVDNSMAICTTDHPHLTSVDLPFAHIGTIAAGYLHRRFCGHQEPVAPVHLPPLRVVARRSTQLALPQRPLVRRACTLFDQRRRAPLTVAAVARRLNVAPNTLYLAFIDDLGISPKQYQRRNRLEQAAELLITTDRPIDRVARDTGFATARSLAKAFKERFACPPSHFREIGQQHPEAS